MGLIYLLLSHEVKAGYLTWTVMILKFFDEKSKDNGFRIKKIRLKLKSSSITRLRSLKAIYECLRFNIVFISVKFQFMHLSSQGSFLLLNVVSSLTRFGSFGRMATVL